MSETEALQVVDEASPNREDAKRHGGLREHDESLVEIVAAKVLIDWLRNRQQLLVPFTIDLQKLDSVDIELLLHGMVAAAQADGTVDGKERERVRAALERLNASEEQLAKLDGALDSPLPLAHALAEVKDMQTGAIVYAASLLAIDRRKLVNRQFLRYLAARLQLPKDLTRSLEQRFFVSVE
jgi:uncharacterized membrane protein YebE (DUF533 family)